MSSEIPKPVEIRKTKGYLLRRIVGKWPLLVWIGMALLTYQLHKRGVRFERMNGVVDAETQVITAFEKGVIQGMSVTESGQAVEPGQVVVKMDPRMLEGERDQIKQELEAAALDQERKTSTMKTDLNSEISDLKLQKAGDESELEALEKNLVTLKERRAENLVSQSQVDAVELKVKTLRASLPFYDNRLAELQVELEKVDALLTRIKEAAGKEAVILKLYEDRIERMNLTSPVGGSVSQIFARPGAVVDDGDPIVSIINLDSKIARGFIVEENAGKVSVGMPVFIRATGEADAPYHEGKITYIAPQISSTPDIGSSVAGRMIKGREITCSFDNQSVELLPGQSVAIHLEKPGKVKFFSFGN